MTEHYEGNFSQNNNAKYLSLEKVLGFDKLTRTIVNLSETAPSGKILYNLGRSNIKLRYDPNTIDEKPLIIEEVGRSQSNSKLDISVKIRNYSGHQSNGVINSLGTSDYVVSVRFKETKSNLLSVHSDS